MKLPELKSKFKNRYAIRIIAGVLVVTLVATGSSVYSVNAAKAGSAATENVEETEVSEEAEDTEDAESSLKDLLDNGSKVSEKEIGKEETVYVIADNTGKEQKIIVSDHICRILCDFDLFLFPDVHFLCHCRFFHLISMLGSNRSAKHFRQLPRLIKRSNIPPCRGFRNSDLL